MSSSSFLSIQELEALWEADTAFSIIIRPIIIFLEVHLLNPACLTKTLPCNFFIIYGGKKEKHITKEQNGHRNAFYLYLQVYLFWQLKKVVFGFMVKNRAWLFLMCFYHLYRVEQNISLKA